MTDPSDLKFTQDYLVYRPRRQGVFPISEVDWNRIKRMLQAVVPPSRTWQNLASAMLSIGFSGILSLVGFSLAKNLPAWIVPTVLAIIVSSFVLAGSFFLIDRQSGRMREGSVAAVQAEMDSIEQAFVRAEEERAADVAAGPRPMTEFIDSTDFFPDDVVFHSKFGIGRVKSIHEDPEHGAEVVVIFDDAKIRRLAPEFARLKKIVVNMPGG